MERQQRKPRNYRREMQQRAEQFAEPQPDDQQIGQWPGQKLERMNEAFAAALARAAKDRS